MIDIKNLTITYPNDHVAIDNLSLQVNDGETIALIGANGAGKSTLFLSLVGMIKASKGNIIVDGYELNKKNLAHIREILGLVFQNPDDQLFMPYVHEEIAFGPRNYGVKQEEIDKRIDKVLADLKIQHLRDRMPNKLSGGEKRMVAIGSVLAMNPKVILFDEPASFLDPKARRNLIATLKEINTTKIIATHDLDLARQVCDRVIFLRQGKILSDNTTEKILDNQDLLEAGGL